MTLSPTDLRRHANKMSPLGKGGTSLDRAIVREAAYRLADVIEAMQGDLEQPSGFGEQYDNGYDVAARAVLRIAGGETP